MAGQEVLTKFESAVPNYLRSALTQSWDALPPGHRFNPYFRGWNPDDWTLDGRVLKKSQEVTERGLGKKIGLEKVLPVGRPAQDLTKSWRERQQALAAALGEGQAMIVFAETSAPLLTGLGLEHPLENGFTFLPPYGLPCLPGSGIKGVVRRAAEELALGTAGDPRGWDVLWLWDLFGFDHTSSYLTGPAPEGKGKTPEYLQPVARAWREAYGAHIQRLPAERVREWLGRRGLKSAEPAAWLEGLAEFGAKGRDARAKVHVAGRLRFWDALLDCGEEMAMEILTPHSGMYFGTAKDADRSKPSLAECYSPIPTTFLAVPAGAKLQMVVELQAGAGEDAWRDLVQAALEHAFTLGFGAKTSLGYGQIQRDAEAEKAREKARAAAAGERARLAAKAETERQRQAELARLAPGERRLRELAEAGASVGHLINLLEKDEHWQNPEERRQAATAIQAQMREEGAWKPETKAKKPAKDHDHQDTLRVLRFLP